MHQLPKTLYTVNEIREFERLATEEFGISGYTMMKRAGYGAFRAMMTYWPRVKKICIVAGTGNNAGDGYVLAQIAKHHGIAVTIAQVGEIEKVKGPALEALRKCYEQSIEVHSFRPELLWEVDLIVDALLGIGAKGILRPLQASVISRINQTQKPVLSIDVPSGLCADTGASLGEVTKANVTVTFIGVKRGLLTHDGVEYCGHILFDDLEFPMTLKTRLRPAALRLVFEDFVERLQPRHRNTHKGNYGHVVVIGGNYGYAGAVIMAGMAAMRVGAGLVTVATRPEYVAAVTAHCPELMCVGIENPADLLSLLDRASVKVLGPGLGTSDWSYAIWETAVHYPVPTVIDADGLNLLAKFPHYSENWILTPHPGEAARLLQVNTEQVQRDRFAAIHLLQKNFGGACVLKGPGSLIIGADLLPRVCTDGNPGMATGGMGDILSGVIGGLLAQGLSLVEATRLGVLVHGKAADHAAKLGERGMMATDLLPYLRTLVNP